MIPAGHFRYSAQEGGTQANAADDVSINDYRSPVRPR
jgi:hypothetical protein